MPEEEHSRRSSKASEHLEALSALHASQYPLFFISFRSEIDTRTLIRRRLDEKLPVLVPRTLIKDRKLEIYRIRDWSQDLKTGAYGILEPNPEFAHILSDPAVIDLVLVPGSVFDRKCGRYGYGGGFYDRFLANEAKNALRVGYAFSFQVKEEIPLLPHDERLDMIVTDEGVISCRDIA